MLDFGSHPWNASVTVDWSRCQHCGACAKVCFGAPLHMVDGRLKVDPGRLFGCIGCGHCVCVCPNDAISVEGRGFKMDDLAPLPEVREADVFSVMHSRRSIRRFTEQEVEDDKVQQILDSVATAPMGLPPSEVGLMVFRNSAAVQSFAAEIVASFRRHFWVSSKPFNLVTKLLAGRETAIAMEQFFGPAMRFICEKRSEGEDWLLYNAPLALFFYGSGFCDPADPIIAADHAMLAAESIGLGTVFIGTPGYFLKSDRTLRRKYGLPKQPAAGLILLAGYPAVRFRKTMRRKLGHVRILGGDNPVP